MVQGVDFWTIFAYYYFINKQRNVIQFRPHQLRALDAIKNHKRGSVIIPTGGGKTYVMIADALRRMDESNRPLTFVIVAPRILLANQLCEEFFEFPGITRPDLVPAHVHSGETKHFKSTKPERIAMFDKMCEQMQCHRMIFTTYHSLHRVIESGIDVDVMYCDEAHNSTQRNHFKKIETMAMCISEFNYFFTATPKRAKGNGKNGMDNTTIYGGVICSVPAPELIESGSIIPPQIHAHETDLVRCKDTAATIDAKTVVEILESLTETQSSKVLVAAPSTRVMWNMLSNTDIIEELTKQGYGVMHITSKHGAYVNKTKVNREQFFQTLQEWGLDRDKKFILFHYSILSEGINVPGLTHTILLRNLPVIEMAQTIGRVIRTDRDDIKDMQSGVIPTGACHLYRKPCGHVTIPVHSNYGQAIAKRVQNLVDAVFVKGQYVFG